MPKQIPVPNALNKPFWDAANQRKLVVQNCTVDKRLQYPPQPVCAQCGKADNLEWKEVKGRGHIMEYFVVRDTRVRRLMADQPFNMAVITLDEEPALNFLSNLPGTPPGEAPIGAAVEVLFEQIVGADQLIPEWRVIK